jgi:hypothetical protein
VLGTVLGYLLNVLLTHVVFRGPGAFDGSSGLFSSLARSAVFCGICSSLAFGLIGYRLSVGRERFGQALRALPGNVSRLFRHDGQHARVHLLWGAAVSFMLMQIVTPLLGAALAVGLMTALPSLVGRALANLLARAFSQGAHALGATRAIPARPFAGNGRRHDRQRAGARHRPRDRGRRHEAGAGGGLRNRRHRARQGSPADNRGQAPADGRPGGAARPGSVRSAVRPRGRSTDPGRNGAALRTAGLWRVAPRQRVALRPHRCSVRGIRGALGPGDRPDRRTNRRRLGRRREGGRIDA